MGTCNNGTTYNISNSTTDTALNMMNHVSFFSTAMKLKWYDYLLTIDLLFMNMKQINMVHDNNTSNKKS